MIQAKTASDSLSLNEITFTQKNNFLLDSLWSWKGGFPHQKQGQTFMTKFNVLLFQKGLERIQMTDRDFKIVQCRCMFTFIWSECF